MEPALCQDADALTIPAALVVSTLRYLRESVVDLLDRAPGIQVCGQAGTLEHAITAISILQPELVLMDAGFPDGERAAWQLGVAAPRSNIVLLGMVETKENVLAWAEAGVVGYVPNTASLHDLVALISQISRSEQACPTHIAAGMLRRLAAGAHAPSAATFICKPQLTQREQEILQLVGAGLSNKTIARRLEISLGTTKSHVHNLLAKLRVRRRADVMRYLHDHAPRPTETI